MEAGLYEKIKQRVETHIKTYEDPELDANGKPVIKAKKPEKTDDDTLEEDLR